MGKENKSIEEFNNQLTHEIALLIRDRFTERSEQLSSSQVSLIHELIDTNIAAIEAG